MDLGPRFDELATNVLGPLVLGGTMRLVRPIGARLAFQLAEGRSIVDIDLASRVDVARVRRARLLAPVDTVLPIDDGSWALVAALNDLLQVTNHELGGVLTRGRHRRLLANVRAIAARVPAPETVEEAIARHATFARVFELVRTDSTVSWWTGSTHFRGQPPSNRLLLWPKLRKVEVSAQNVALPEMFGGVQAVSPDAFQETLGVWLARSPLTDVAFATRSAPAFAWSSTTLGLLVRGPARSLAFRAAMRQPAKLIVPVLAHAAKQLSDAPEEQRRLAESFASEVAAGLKLFGEAEA